jgi:two-component system chemotaxis family response regulator WspR
MSTDRPKARPPAVTSAEATDGSKVLDTGFHRHVRGPTQPSVDDYNCIVLLVDDQIIIGEAVRRALADEPNLVLHFCSDPKEAFATAERIEPTVILQDLVMPAIDGLTLVRKYRAHASTRNTPIIVLSTREEAETKRDAFAAGANDYMVKLPDKLELIARIRYHSQACLSRRQRDAAYRALHESQRQLMDANLQLQRLSNMDALTGLNNRRRFDEYAATEWRRARREQTSLAVLLVDVDHFKAYNDEYGHLAGDDALKRVGEAIRTSCVRPADLPARYGGDEFVILLPGVRIDAAHLIGERLRLTVRDLNIVYGADSTGDTLTLSIGGSATIPTQEDGLLDLIGRADKCMYEAKANGRNRVVIRE